MRLFSENDNWGGGRVFLVEDAGSIHVQGCKLENALREINLCFPDLGDITDDDLKKVFLKFGKLTAEDSRTAIEHLVYEIGHKALDGEKYYDYALELLFFMLGGIANHPCFGDLIINLSAFNEAQPKSDDEKVFQVKLQSLLRSMLSEIMEATSKENDQSQPLMNQLMLTIAVFFDKFCQYELYEIKRQSQFSIMDIRESIRSFMDLTFSSLVKNFLKVRHDHSSTFSLEDSAQMARAFIIHAMALKNREDLSKDIGDLVEEKLCVFVNSYIIPRAPMPASGQSLG